MELIKQEDNQYDRYKALQSEKWKHYNSTYINLNIEYPKQVGNVINSLVEDKSIRLAAGIVVCNLLALKDEFVLAYSRKRVTLPVTYNKRKISYNKLIKATEWLVANGYALEQRGKPSVDPESRYASTLWPLEALFKLFKDQPKLSTALRSSYLKTSATVILKDSKKNETEYKQTEETVNMEDVMNTINASNNKHVFKDHTGKLLNCSSLTRIFTETFAFGGRLYRTDAHQIKQQGADKHTTRLGITIDDLPVVEVDYCNLHAMILCALEGIHPAKYHGDMYEYVLKHYNIPYAQQDRKLIKQSFNIMLNSDSSGKALRAIQGLINSQPINQERYSIRSGADVWNMIYDSMPEFNKYFDNPDKIGLRLQRMDSDMAARVCYIFAKENFPIVPIHDSMLVLDDHGDKLLWEMSQAFRAVVDCPKNFPVMLRVESMYFPDEIVVM